MTNEKFRQSCISFARDRRDTTPFQVRALVKQRRLGKLRVEREKCRRILSGGDELIGRYRNEIDRTITKYLHEIQRLQATRSGVFVPPPASVDVNMHVQAAGDGFPEAHEMLHTEESMCATMSGSTVETSAQKSG